MVFLSFGPFCALWILLWALSDRRRSQTLFFLLLILVPPVSWMHECVQMNRISRAKFSVDESRHRNMVRWNVMQTPLSKIRCFRGQEDKIRGNECETMPVTHVQRGCTVWEMVGLFLVAWNEMALSCHTKSLSGSLQIIQWLSQVLTCLNGF